MVASYLYPIGTWVYVYGVRSGVLKRCQVVDTSAPKDRARHIRTRRVVEVSYENALALCTHLDEPVVECPVIVLDAP